MLRFPSFWLSHVGFQKTCEFLWFLMERQSVAYRHGVEEGRLDSKNMIVFERRSEHFDGTHIL